MLPLFNFCTIYFTNKIMLSCKMLKNVFKLLQHKVRVIVVVVIT